LRQRFEEGKNLQEVGNFFGLNYSTISIIQRTAILKLRRYFDKKEESKIKPVDSGVIRAANDREVLLEIKKCSDQRERFDIEFSGKVEEVKEKKDNMLISWGIEYLNLNEKEIEELKEDPRTFWDQFDRKDEHNVLILDDIKFI
jgi:hypothetical protein